MACSGRRLNAVTIISLRLYVRKLAASARVSLIEDAHRLKYFDEGQSWLFEGPLSNAALAAYTALAAFAALAARMRFR